MRRASAPRIRLRRSGVFLVRGKETMARDTTLLELVSAVANHAATEAELIATVVYLVNSGTVRLCGTFKGSRFDPDEGRAVA